ncbi:MAG: Type secretion system ATPase TadZ/CpaE, associated with Flp pilus assembly [Micavibrio sp.]|nr:Type secretion system ATPase TadZ/CpaE, associated with Flp pilus assembly [Micavibrio sp.]
MAEFDDTYTSILLPQSRVAMYARDLQSIQAFKSLQSDWRFTRVSLDQLEGGVDQATIDLQSGKPAPSLLIIETDTIDDSFTAKLETLAGYCPEGTAAIVIGPVNDVNLYRKLIAMGISDYVVRPVKTETLAFDIARSLIERIGATGSRLVALVGAKGGVGTTSLAQAMAWGAADMLNQKTVLLDGAGGWSTLNVGMNFEPATTLGEASRTAAGNNQDAFKRMLFQASDKLQVLSSGGDVMLEDGIDADSYEALLDKLMTTYPVVIVDLSHSPTALRRIVIARAHQITLVATPLLAPLRSARSLLQEIKDIRADSESRVDLVINKAGMASRHEVSKADLESALDRKPSMIIEYNPALFMGAEGEGRKLNATAEGQDVVRSLLPLMLKILDGVTDTSSIANDQKQKNPLSGILGRLKTKS